MADKTYDEATVKKLRQEAAKYRTAYAPFRDAMEGYSEEEVSYMLGVLTKLGNVDTQSEGAVELRDLTRRVLKEDFYDGLDIEAPDAAQEAEEGEDDVSLTKEELQALLTEERELTKKEQAEARKAEKEADEKAARIEAVFQAVEAEGFKRGTEGFMTMLALAETAENLGKEINFGELAPKVTAYLGEEGAAADADGGPEAKEEEEAPAEKEKGRHPKTAKKGTSGSAAEEEVDFVEAAKAEGKDLMEVARERAEARLYGE